MHKQNLGNVGLFDIPKSELFPQNQLKSLTNCFQITNKLGINDLFQWFSCNVL